MAKRDENKDIRNFSIALAVLLAIFAGLGWHKGKASWPYFAGAGGLVLVLGLFVRTAMRPIFRGWMWFAQKLNWATTRVLLTVFWLIVFLPIGLILRLFRVDFFDRRWEPAKQSYWHERPDTPPDRRRAERLG